MTCRLFLRRFMFGLFVISVDLEETKEEGFGWTLPRKEEIA